ncbi:MAG TPA: methylated-DNA--[protein]-cysteine S-methyltransferase [Woeseiaceae bacterium]|nr:methylated-DNA--[protein]-cysteine S-methyltransferase [Woeseiaceae bacterium]
MTGSSELQKRMQRIWTTVCDIPAGKVASYGQIAEIAGVPRGARQVGYALKHVPDDLEVPWHRVIRSSGRLAFDDNTRAFKRQVKRLSMEDVPVLKGRVNMRKYRWEPDLDELLWKPSAAWDEERERKR